MLHLILATGLILATPRSNSLDAAVISNLRIKYPHQPDTFYYNARSLRDPLVDFEETDFCAVQILFLMTLYMLCRSKRNAAYTLLGKRCLLTAMTFLTRSQVWQYDALMLWACIFGKTNCSRRRGQFGGCSQSTAKFTRCFSTEFGRCQHSSRSQSQRLSIPHPRAREDLSAA